MINEKRDLYVNNAPIQIHPQPVAGGYVEMLGETYYRISDYDQMPPFFMSLVSSADHWLFISSSGGLSAGRIDADSALFPYETEDKISNHHELTGSKTILRAQRGGQWYLWEPFSNRYAGLYRIEHHLYKNVLGDKLMFEAINLDLKLRMRLMWRTSDRFGFVKSCWLQNDGQETCEIELLDGLQNILPSGATEALQTSFSSLLHAYKRNELDEARGMGIYELSATLTDQAEPSESLMATVAWQNGLPAELYLLCSDQLDSFRQGYRLRQELDLKGKPGSYFVQAAFSLAAGAEQRWHIVADVNLDSAAVVRLGEFLQQEGEIIEQALEMDIARNSEELTRYVAAADGLQLSAEKTTSAHHFANTLFNIMRGGIFANGYQVERARLRNFMRIRNRRVFETQKGWLEELPETVDIQALYKRAAATGSPDLIRLCYEYLPLFFSRRHGDPSRPWNQFAIHLKKDDGSRDFSYQGNWRDIFQNWEPLIFSFPAFAEGVIAKFLNATTADGYNPYRVNPDGIEWEVPEPDNPWSNIGYWSDHQIIYLQKLLEIAEQVEPEALARLWNRPVFAYADVPYRLASYEAMLEDWYNTIEFDWAGQREAEAAVERMGTDGRLQRDDDGHVVHVTMMEKMLTLLLAKLTNLVPEGGIWMNTQRPEWNDANNALVGKGLSVVTAAYLRRFICFWRARMENLEDEWFPVNRAVAAMFAEVQRIFMAYRAQLEAGFDNGTRRAFMDEMGAAITAYRATVYEAGVPSAQEELARGEIAELLDVAQAYIERTLRANRRADALYHTYNILRLGEQTAAVDSLYLMLEGQVAILSAGMLTTTESLDLLRSLRHSDLYRADQHSYMLYPNRELPGFQEKNNVPAIKVKDSILVAKLTEAGDRRLLIRDVAGVYHFNGRFRNADDVKRTLDELQEDPAFGALVPAERAYILELFEQTFNHSAFTGRSGTFFAFEGLGSVYWHMVSKLLLAAQECYLRAVVEGADAAVVSGLADVYYDIRAGIGFNKAPDEYGAFPTDPYSHTPLGSGARQPGMTGQVKEEILTRWGELGVSFAERRLQFSPTLLRVDEFLSRPGAFSLVDVSGELQTLPLSAGAMAFTYCQTPVIYERGKEARIVVDYEDGHRKELVGRRLDAETTQRILNRVGNIKQVQVTVPLDQ